MTDWIIYEATCLKGKANKLKDFVAFVQKFNYEDMPNIVIEIYFHEKTVLCDLHEKLMNLQLLRSFNGSGNNKITKPDINHVSNS